MDSFLGHPKSICGADGDKSRASDGESLCTVSHLYLAYHGGQAEIN